MNIELVGEGVLIVVLSVVLVGLLAVYVRFSVISERTTRGWQGRLAHPRRKDVEDEWNVRLPPALDEFYQESGIVERSDFYLAPPDDAESRRWYIASFIPLTARDCAEWRRVTAVPGIPLALDEDKGLYYLPLELLRLNGTAPVFLRKPGMTSPEDICVAPSVDEFARFRPVEASDAVDDAS